jgi:uncharacterized protein with HEPN domain
MSQRDDKVYLKDMLDYAREAVKMVSGKRKLILIKIECLNWLLRDWLK